MTGSIQGIVRLYAFDRPMNVEIKDTDGNNILHLACKKGDLLVVRTLLLLFEHRYELSKKKNKQGKRPIEVCEKHDVR